MAGGLSAPEPPRAPRGPPHGPGACAPRARRGGYGWRDHATSVIRGSASPRRSRPWPRDLSAAERGATRWRVRSRRPRTALLDERRTTSTWVMEWLDRSSDDQRRLIPSHTRVPRAVFGDCRARAGRRQVDSFRAVERLAAGEAARRAPSEVRGRREDIGGSTASSVPLFLLGRSRGRAGEAEADARIEAEREAPRTGPRRSLRVPEAASSGDVVAAEGVDPQQGRSAPRERRLVLGAGQARYRPNGSGKRAAEEIVGGRLGRIGHGVESLILPARGRLDERGGAHARWAPTGCSARGKALWALSLLGWEDHDKPWWRSRRRRRRLGCAGRCSGATLLPRRATNHLALESRSARGGARGVPGTVLLVSHDRAGSTRSPTIVAVEGDDTLLRRRLGRYGPRPRGQTRRRRPEGAEGEARRQSRQAAPERARAIEASIHARS